MEYNDQKEKPRSPALESLERKSEVNQGETNGPEELSLKELFVKLGRWFEYLLSKWKIIILFSFFGGLLGLAYSFTKEPIYKATTTFVLETGGNSGIRQYSGLASMIGMDLGGSSDGIFQGDNIFELYKSRTMIEKTLLSVIDSNGGEQLLIDHYLDFKKLRDSWAEKPDLKSIHFTRKPGQPFTRTQDSILGIIVKDINENYLNVARQDNKISILKVEVEAEDEAFAKRFNDQIVQNVNDFYVQTKTKKSLENVAIFQHKSDSVRNVLNGAIYNSAAVLDATPNLNPTRQVQRTAPLQRSQFSVETNKVILAELLKNLEMSRMALLKETPLIQVIDRPVFPLEKKIFGKKKAIILGGLLFGFLSVLLLLTHKIYKSIMVDELENGY